MSEQSDKARRLVSAHETLKVVWTAYRDGNDYIEVYDGTVREALEVALDEIDCALLRLPDVSIVFEYRTDNENGSQ